jgi:NDP-sugar pyrophosphorylase family protein
MKFRVLITTSGKGTRLGKITNYTNKSLVRVGSKPVISHIIDNYPDNTEFIITIGYFGNQVKDFLELYYPTKKFNFVVVDKYEGEGSSLLYSLLKAKEFLQNPFIYHACDTLTFDKIPNLSNNWVSGFQMNDSSSYASISVLGDKVSDIHDKGFINYDFIHIGLVGIKDYKIFWKTAEKIITDLPNDQTLGDVNVLQKIIKKVDFTIHKSKSWFDIGSVKGLNKARLKIKDSDFNVLEKLAESIFFKQKKVIKFFSDSKICKNRIERVKYMNNTTPKILDKRDNFFSYEMVDGQLFAKTANRNNFVDLINWAEKNLWNDVHGVDLNEFRDKCFKFYKEKTTDRINQFFKKKNLTDKSDIINGEKVPKISHLLKKIDFDKLSVSKPKNFHGDFILDNILVDSNNNFKLIDWRQDFCGDIESGDMYYDLAKLAHNLVVNHELIEKDLFEINFENNQINLNINRYNSLVDCERLYFKYLEKNNYDVRKVKILRSIIWLNMSPLHHHPFDLFLFYFGKYTLKNELENDKT